MAVATPSRPDVMNISSHTEYEVISRQISGSCAEVRWVDETFLVTGLSMWKLCLSYSGKTFFILATDILVISVFQKSLQLMNDLQVRSCLFTELQRAVDPGVLLHGETLGKTFWMLCFFCSAWWDWLCLKIGTILIEAYPIEMLYGCHCEAGLHQGMNLRSSFRFLTSWQMGCSSQWPGWSGQSISPCSTAAI